MANKFFDKFSLHYDKEEFPSLIESISNGVVFRGTNLWVLIFAIFIASLGLNVNSTAVIIGAMLISPLMGPIIGIGLSMGISDIGLLRKSFYNYFIATIVALITSFIFFLISPLNDAHSEILARASPTIYDVLIALFGGFAGIVATSSRLKGNVIPGVAIATALMPPLCTAGYGLATLEFHFFIGAFYLFIINSVFIALATFIIVRILHFPYKHQQNARAERVAKRIVWLVVIATLVPSIYFGYEMVQENRFTKSANNFINNEAHFNNDYLLNKKIDAKNKKITLVFGGNEILQKDIDSLKRQLNKYGLGDVELEVKQGFAYLADNRGGEEDENFIHLNEALAESEKQNSLLKNMLDSNAKQKELSNQLYLELKAQYPAIKNAVLQPAIFYSDSSKKQNYFLVFLSLSRNLPASDKAKLSNWLKVRLRNDSVNLILQR